MTWGIFGIGLLAAFGLLGLATVPNAPGWAVAIALALLGVRTRRGAVQDPVASATNAAMAAVKACRLDSHA